MSFKIADMKTGNALYGKTTLPVFKNSFYSRRFYERAHKSEIPVCMAQKVLKFAKPRGFYKLEIAGHFFNLYLRRIFPKLPSYFNYTF